MLEWWVILAREKCQIQIANVIKLHVWPSCSDVVVCCRRHAVYRTRWGCV